MSFISYAQNREDVLLWRALSDVVNGFYVDVGANHPSEDSITKALYDRGWSGINIEPLEEHVAQLRAERPRDINLQLAMGSTEGEAKIFLGRARGLATLSTEVAHTHELGGEAQESRQVPMRRLDSVLEEYAPAQVHFLKIDVEGFERQVLEGMDFSRFRPWIVVVEATIPNTQTLDLNWEPLLLGANYVNAYFDGLNCYFVAQERSSLLPRLTSPPNVFDNFITSEQHRLSMELGATRETLDQTRSDVVALNKQLKELQAQIDTLLTSRIWRMTAPLRRAVETLRSHHPSNVLTALRDHAMRLSWDMARRAADFVATRPGCSGEFIRWCVPWDCARWPSRCTTFCVRGSWQSTGSAGAGLDRPARRCG